MDRKSHKWFFSKLEASVSGSPRILDANTERAHWKVREEEQKNSEHSVRKRDLIALGDLLCSEID